MQAEILIGKRKGMSNFFRQFFTHLDFSLMKYKIEERLFGLFRWGNFEPLPKIDYVLIFRQLFAKCETCTIDEFENSRNSYYQISLVHHKTRRIVVHETKDRNEAFSLAKEIATQTNRRVLDSASNRRKSVWLDL